MGTRVFRGRVTVRRRFGLHGILNGQHMADRRNAANGFHRKKPETVRQRSDEFPVDVHGAAAHPRDHPRIIDIGARNTDHDDIVFRVERVFHDAQYFDVEGVDPGVLKDREAVSAHARPHLVDIHEPGGGLAGGRHSGYKQACEEGKHDDRSIDIHRAAAW